MSSNVQNLLYLSCFIDLFGVSFILPVFGLHLRSLEFNFSQIGVISSVYSAIQLLSGPVIGSWSDAYGRKTVLCVTQFICAFAYFMLSVTTSFTLILFVRVLLGLMKHTQTICKALVADYIPSDKQPEIQGKLNGVAALGFMVGPIIGGHIGELENGFLYICYATAIMFIVNSLIVHLWFPVVQGQQRIRRNSNSNSSMTLTVYDIINDLQNVNWKCYYDVFSLKFILGISLALFYSNYYLFVENRFNITPKYIGYTVSFQGFVSAASSTQIKYFNRFYNGHSVSSYLKICHCFIILSISLLIIYFSTNIYIFLLCLLPMSGSSSLIRIITTELLLIKSDEKHRGSLMGASNSVSSSTRFIAPLITGVLQDLTQTSNIMAFGVVLSLTGSIISYIVRTKYSDKYKAT